MTFERLDRRTIFFVLVTFTLVSRILWIAVVDSQPTVDWKWYYERAVNLWEGRGYTIDGKATAWWPPGYSYTLSALFAISGPSVFSAKMFNAVLSVLVVILVWNIASILSQSRTVVFIATGLIAIHPNFLAYASLTSPEILLLATFLSFTLCFLLEVNSPSPKSSLWQGLSILSFAATLYIKPIVIFLPFVLAVVMMKQKPISWWTRRLFVLYLATVILHLPWIMRNYQEFGGFVFVSTNGGFNLLIGNHPDISKWWPDDSTIQRVTAKASSAQNELARDRILFNEALEHIVRNPFLLLARIPKKFLYLYRSDVEGFTMNMWGLKDPQKANWLFLKTLAQVYYLVIFLFFIVMVVRGIVLGGVRFLQEYRFIFAIIAYFTLIYLVFFGAARFRLPVMPFIFILVAAEFVKFRHLNHAYQSNSQDNH